MVVVLDNDVRDRGRDKKDESSDLMSLDKGRSQELYEKADQVDTGDEGPRVLMLAEEEVEELKLLVTRISLGIMLVSICKLCGRKEMHEQQNTS